MDLDKLLKDADSARKLKPHKGDMAGFRTNRTEGSGSARGSRVGLLGSLLLLLVGSGGSTENEDEDNGNILCDLDEFRAGDYDMSKPTAEQLVGSPYLRLGVPRN